MKISSAAQSKARLVAMRLTSHTLRSMEYWSRLAGGYDEAMVLIAVAAITTDKLSRAPMTDYQMDLRNALDREIYARCSITSIAEATGLNRETARRKVNELVERGYLQRAGRGSVAFRAGFQQEPLVRDAVNAQLEAFRRTAEALVRDGVLILR